MAHHGPPECPTWSLLVEDAPDVELGDEKDHDLAGRSKELEADLLEDLEADEELEEDLDEDDEELVEDLNEDDEEHEADEDETSACAPYLARQMSCLGSRTPGVKVPLFRFGMGREGG